MKTKILSILIPLCLLSACATNHNLTKNDRQKDYFGDTQEIFSRKNCVGSTGSWVNTDNARGGYYCASPECKIRDSLTCTDNCDHY